MKVKILTRKQAIELGLTNKLQGKSGGGMVGGGAIVNVNKATGKQTVIESFMEKDGKKELTFMSKERREYLKGQNDFKNYIKQFNKIPKEVEDELHN